MYNVYPHPPAEPGNDVSLYQLSIVKYNPTWTTTYIAYIALLQSSHYIFTLVFMFTLPSSWWLTKLTRLPCWVWFDSLFLTGKYLNDGTYFSRQGGKAVGSSYLFVDDVVIITLGWVVCIFTHNQNVTCFPDLIH